MSSIINNNNLKNKKSIQNISHQASVNRDNSQLSLTAQGQTSFEQRLNIIETNLSRVCLQQDALMPLLCVVEILPQLQKSENNIKTMQKRIDDFDNKQKQQEKFIEKKLKEFQNCNMNLRQNQNLLNCGSTQQLSQDGKQIKQIIEVQDQIKEIEQQLQRFNKYVDQKIRDEENKLNKLVEQKFQSIQNQNQMQLDDVMQKIQVQTNQQSHTNNKKSNGQLEEKEWGRIYQEITKQIDLFKTEIEQFIVVEMKNNNDQKLKQEDENKCNESFVDEFNSFKESIEQEIRNIYKDQGGIKSELEFLTNLPRKNKILEQLARMPKIQDPNEKSLKINILEQECFISEMEIYDKENTQRILYEIESINKDCEKYEYNCEQLGDTQSMIQLQKEIDFLLEKQVNLKYQVSGTKKKIVMDMKKIEEKFEYLGLIKNSDQGKVNFQDKEVILKMEERLRKLMQSINNNIEICQNNLGIVGQRVENLKSYVNPSSESIFQN